MSIPEFSTRKEPFKPTAHKSDFSFSSPQQDPQTVLKQTTLESRRIDMTTRNRKQLFSDLKENTNILSLINKSYTKQFVQQMRTQQRVQVEKLLLEISRLHDLLEDQERMHKYAVQRLKQQSEQIALLRISNLKQSQISQVQAIQIQLKKTRENLQQKCFAYEELEKTTSRKIQSLSNQNQTLRSDLKQLVQKKNLQLFQLRNQFSKQNQESDRKKNQAFQQMKALADKELKKIIKKLEQKQNTIQSLAKQCESTTKENQKIQKMFQKQKQQLLFKLQRTIENQRERQNQLTNNIKQFYQTQAQQFQEELNQQKQVYKFEIQQLRKIISIKDNEAQRNLVFRQTQKIDFKLQIKGLQNQNQYLKKLIGQLKKQQLQQLELLKVKMGVLHKSDIQALVRLYDAKIQSLVKQAQYAKSQAERSDQQAKKQRQTMYQMKKKYDYTISLLRQQIHQLTIGASHFEKQVKQKLQNQKSMMMLTSRNFIKENENKNNNIRFYQQQLRKLRQLLQIQAQQVEQSQKNVEEKIKLAEEELHRLSNKIIQVKSEAQQSQRKLKQIIQEKNKEIKRLNEILNNPTVLTKVGDNLADQVQRLDEELAKKEDEIRSLKNQVEEQQSNMRLIRADNQRLIIENQINTQDAKKKYKFISDKNLADIKAFYQRRLQQLQNDKKELGKVNSSQSQQITQLIKRYKQLEEGMKQLVQQTKKRSDLETRIINLGMDNNLIKNMGQLFYK